MPMTSLARSFMNVLKIQKISFSLVLSLMEKN